MRQKRLHINPLSDICDAGDEPEIAAFYVEDQDISYLIGRRVIPADLVHSPPFREFRGLVPEREGCQRFRMLTGQASEARAC